MVQRFTPGSSELPLSICGGSTFGRYNKISSAQTWNMFLSRDGASDEKWLVNFAGYKRFIQLLASGEGRALFHSVRGNFLLAVVNANVYQISANLTITFIGSLTTERGEVFMDENLNTQIGIVDGLNLYIYNYSGAPSITIQTDSYLGQALIPNYICYHNTFFLIGNGSKVAGNGSGWYVYGYSTATTVVENTFLALQTKPDNALAVVRLPSRGNNVLVLGNAVSEVWTQVGGLQNYQRNSTFNIDYGCLSVSTIATSDTFVAWLGANENNAPTIMVFSGQEAQPISTDGIDYVLSNVNYPAQSTAMMFRQDGHLFYQLTFYNDKDNFTLVYDFTTQLFFNLSDSDLNYHPARSYAYFNNNIYFISLNNGSIYQSSTDITANDENLVGSDPTLISDIPRIRICDSLRADNANSFICNSIQVTIEQGCDPNFSELNLLPVGYDIITQNQKISLVPPLNIVNPDDDIITEGGIPIVDEGAPVYVQNGTFVGSNVTLNQLIYQPRVDLTLSRDGGLTWSNTVSRDLNPLGKRMNMLTWEKLGRANDLTMKFMFWGTSRFVVGAAIVQVYA